MLSVFISYSHRDEAFRNELETHLAMLKRENAIDAWHDRRIEAGKALDEEISAHLDRADMILLLVSPDFLASDYCYGIEVKRALERHEAGRARVIPVILRPCEWNRTGFAGLRATPTDGKPISRFPNRDDAYLVVVRDLRTAAETVAKPVPTTSPSAQSTRPKTSREAPRSSNLRVKRRFSDHEKVRFLDESFEFMANFFEGSLAELKARNAGIEASFRRVDANHFAASIYRGGSLLGSCRVWIRSGIASYQSIAYSAGNTGADNSMNESMSIGEDGYALYLEPIGMAFRHHGRDQHLTQEGAAEYYWGMLIEPLQR